MAMGMLGASSLLCQHSCLLPGMCILLIYIRVSVLELASPDSGAGGGWGGTLAPAGQKPRAHASWCSKKYWKICLVSPARSGKLGWAAAECWLVPSVLKIQAFQDLGQK